MKKKVLSTLTKKVCSELIEQSKLEHVPRTWYVSLRMLIYILSLFPIWAPFELIFFTCSTWVTVEILQPLQNSPLLVTLSLIVAALSKRNILGLLN